MDAFEDAEGGEDAAEMDEGMMLKLLRLRQPQLHWRVLHRGMQSTGCRQRRWGGGGAVGSLIRTCMLQAQHTWWCKPVQTWQTKRGRGSEGQRFTQTADPILTSSGEETNNSFVMEHSHAQKYKQHCWSCATGYAALPPCDNTWLQQKLLGYFTKG